MQQDTTTRVDAVLTALLTEFRTLFPTADVLDGPSTADDNRDTVLVVGTSNDEHGSAYESEQTVEGFAYRPMETITVHCELSTWSGNDSSGQAPLRTALVADLGQIDLYLRQHPTLSGVCDQAYLGNRFRYFVLQSPDGPGCGVAFDVHAMALL